MSRPYAVGLAVALLLLVVLVVARFTWAATPAQIVQGLQCIHRYEGAWSANTGNGFYGGLQMNREFMQAYGPEYLRAWGPAHLWPPAVQIAVAVRAYLSGRGYGPWPHTRRMCGL